MKFSTLFVLGLSMLVMAASCTHRGRVTINTIRPADMTLDSDIEKIVLLDRSKLDERKKLNFLEGLLTGELPEEDKAAVQRALSQMNSTFQRSPRFEATIASERWEGNSLTSAFPEQIPWSKIQMLCDQYKAQAVLAIEIFDSDFIVTNGKRRVKKTVGEGDNKKEIEVEEYYANGIANLTLGIKFYDMVNRNIIDEQIFKRTNTWEASASSRAEALLKLVQKSEATQQLTMAIANDYVYKIAPLPVTLYRSYYTKHRKMPFIEVGARKAQVGMWEEALRTWEQAIPKADTKRAGYLCYNVAIAYEALGDLDKALEFAQKAYVSYGNKDAHNYSRQIIRRKEDEARLLQQQ